jgi:hypothetical protein
MMTTAEPIVPAPDDMEQLVEWELAGETRPSTTLSTTNPTWPDLRSNTSQRSDKPAAKCPSYDMTNQ